MILRPSYLLVVASLLLVAGCGPTAPPPLTAWVASEMTNLTDQTPPANDPLLYDAPHGAVKLFAAANEVVSFQLVLAAGPDGAGDIRLGSPGLAGPGRARIGSDSVKAFRMIPLPITEYPPWYLRLVEELPRPAGFYDALVPVTAPGGQGQPFRLAPGGRLAFWIDLSVPRDTPGGEYAGPLLLTCDGREVSVNLSLKVYPFVLPDARPVAAVGGFDDLVLFRTMVKRPDGSPFQPQTMDRSHPQVRQGLEILRQMMVLGHEHRLDLFDKRIHPAIRRNAAGGVEVDWSDYDAIVRPYLDGSAFEDRIPCTAWPIPFSDAWPDPAAYGGAASYDATATALLAACREHLQPRELEAQMFAWPYRQEVGPEAYEQQARLARLVRTADPGVPILSVLPPRPPEMTGWKLPEDSARLTDITAPPGQWFDPAPAAKSRDEKRPLAGAWLSPGMPPYVPSLGPLATPADVRAIPWFAMKYACTGLFLPEVLNWDGDVLKTAAGAETRLFYPGSAVGLDVVLPSVRLKRLRRGLQDIAYLWLLQQRERAGIATAVTSSMARYAGLAAAGDNYLDPRLDGWVHDGPAWELARRLMAEELTAVIRPHPETEEEVFARRLAWKDFDSQTHSVRVEQVRSRVAPADGGGDLTITLQLDLYNEFARDVEVRLVPERLPEGWRFLEGAAEISRFPAGSRHTLTLTFRCGAAPPSAAGKIALPLNLSIDSGPPTQIDAAVPLIVCEPVTKAPKIDGLLNDWPMRAGFCAGDFRLLGRRGEKNGGLATRQTLAFVTRDERNLYVAFRCQEPSPASLTAMASNSIRYEQLMACGEDLVEVILDPGASARGPEELYHIAVKSNGVMVAERGVRSDPPLGKCEPWPVQASVAVARGDKAWWVEMAIPLAAFGEKGKERFWGVNFTRFAPAGCEASSWAQAPRYFYDPRNLGTMMLVP